MPLKSLYPDIPELPEINVHYAILRRPDQAEWPNFPVHIDGKTGQTRGFRDFVQRVEWAATALSTEVDKGGLGLSPDKGDIVGIMSENSMDYSTFAQACLYATIPLALISSYSKPFELKHSITLLKATCLFVDEKFLSMVLPIAKEAGIPSNRVFVMTGRASRGRKTFSQLIDEVKRDKVEIVDIQPAKKDTLAYLVFSSGTTGLPKAVMISHGNILSSMAQTAILAQSSPDSPVPPSPEDPMRVLAFLPMHHTYGFLMFCVRMFSAPVTAVIMEKWDIDLALDLVPKYRINVIPLIPSVALQFVQHPRLGKTDFSSVERVASGAAYLPPELNEKLSSFARKEVDIIEGYGMSETTLTVLQSPSFETLDGRIKPKRSSTGVLVPGVEARIVRDDGTDAGVNEVGELWLKGPVIALGYWNNEQATKETFVDGWLRTGDKFSVDEKGYFFFADRAKDTLKVSGAQVSPLEIENVLRAHPKKLIEDVTVAGVSGGRLSDEKVPRAWIVLSNEGEKLGATSVIKELEKWHQDNLSKYKWLRGGIEVVKEIPKSPTGKVLRRELQDQYEERLAKSPVGKVKSKL